MQKPNITKPLVYSTITKYGIDVEYEGLKLTFIVEIFQSGVVTMVDRSYCTAKPEYTELKTSEKRRLKKMVEEQVMQTHKKQ
jgi:hypothetical protein